MRIKAISLLCLLLLLLGGCDGDDSSSDDDAGDDDGAADDDADDFEFTVTVLGEGEYVDDDGNVFVYQLLRLSNEDGGYTYAQYFPPPAKAAGPVILAAVPYNGIDWSGDPIDEKWAARPGADVGYSWPDEDGPDYREGSSDIFYQLYEPESYGELSWLYLTNGIGVLHVFGRFYAGGDIENDRHDMIAGMRFLAQEPTADKSRILTSGDSWGAWEAIHAAIYAPAEITVRGVVATAPPYDFVTFHQYLTGLHDEIPDAQIAADYDEFFEPYLRRIEAGAGGAPGDAQADYSLFSFAAAAEGMSCPLLLVHDEWDTLVPVTMSYALADARPDVATGYWYQRTAPIDFLTLPMDHGLFDDDQYEYLSYFLFSSTFMMSHLLDDEQYIFNIFEWYVLLAFAQNVRALQAAHYDVDWFAQRLLDLTDPRLVLFEMNEVVDMISGADLAAAILNEAWGTSLTGGAVVDFLQENGLPPA
ncbi:MAG TPA: hypothetical protein PKW95_05525 [bacterium]|nr:hypothetical protein [bacterium]